MTDVGLSALSITGAASGAVVVTYADVSLDGAPKLALRRAHRTPGATVWSEIESAAEGVAFHDEFELLPASDSAGNRVVAWIDSNGAARRLSYSRYYMGAGFTRRMAPIAAVQDDRNWHDMRIAMQPDGRAMLLWQDTGAEDWAIWASSFE